MVGAAIHEAYAPTMPGRTLGYMVNLIAEDSGHNCCLLADWPEKRLRARKWMRLEDAAAAVDEEQLKKLIMGFRKNLG